MSRLESVGSAVQTSSSVPALSQGAGWADLLCLEQDAQTPFLYTCEAKRQEDAASASMKNYSSLAMLYVPMMKYV